MHAFTINCESCLPLDMHSQSQSQFLGKAVQPTHFSSPFAATQAMHHNVNHNLKCSQNSAHLKLIEKRIYRVQGQSI